MSDTNLWGEVNVILVQGSQASPACPDNGRMRMEVSIKDRILIQRADL